MSLTAPVDVEFSEEAHDAFRQFGAYSNLRAIPDVIDGMKPGGRRILWAMHEQRYFPDRKTVKAMSAIGDVLKYHPHGDSGTYDAMVTMAHVPDEGRPVKRYMPFLHGQGSWGDHDNGAAAPRYTECRLNAAAMAMLGDTKVVPSGVGGEIAENAVDMIPNYAGDRREPVVLPALLPAFVINGVEGIGTGVSTLSASHNIREVMNLAARMVDSPNPRWSTVAEILPGPDMPADCDIFDDPGDYGIRSYMETGYGRFFMRARYAIEAEGSGKNLTHRMVVTGLPYRQSPTMVIAGIAQLVANEDLPYDIAAQNLSAGTEMRLVIDLGRNDVAETVQRLLFHGKTSGLQTSFSVQCHGVVDGRVRTVSTLDALRHWLDHRRTVIRRRTRYRLDRAEERLEIVLGYLKAVPIANEIVDLVRASANRAEASAAMVVRWGFTERQTYAILDMALGRLTKLGTAEYESERAELEALIRDCREILGDAAVLDRLLKSEIRAVRDAFGEDRRCTLRLGEEPTVARPEKPAIEIPEKPLLLVRTGKNWLRTVTRRNFNRVVGNDHVTDIFDATDQSVLEAISSKGYHYRRPLTDVPDRMTKGEALFPNLDADEQLIFVGTSRGARNRPDGSVPDLVLLTSDLKVKRVSSDVWVNHKQNGTYFSMLNRDGATITHAFFLPAGADIALLTAYGRMLKLDSDKILAKGKSAAGNPVIRLDAEDDRIVWAGSVLDADDLTYWTTRDRVGWFGIREVGYGGRNSRGEAITRSQSLIAGARLDWEDNALLRYFDGTTEEPRSLSLKGMRHGTKLTDRQMEEAAAEKISRANAVWLEPLPAEEA